MIAFLLSVTASPNLWLKLLKYLKQDPSEFIMHFEENINRVLIEEYNASQVTVSSVPYHFNLQNNLSKCHELKQVL